MEAAPNNGTLACIMHRFPVCVTDDFGLDAKILLVRRISVVGVFPILESSMRLL